MEREKLGSRLGFILLSAGCAIGCGNVWKFPWMCGQYGGGGFVLLYFFCLVILGLPIMIMEFSVGRAAQASPIKMYQKLEKKGARNGIFMGMFHSLEAWPDGVLHGGHRVDCVLFCAVSDGKYPGSGIFVHDYKPGG